VRGLVQKPRPDPRPDPLEPPVQCPTNCRIIHLGAYTPLWPRPAWGCSPAEKVRTPCIIGREMLRGWGTMRADLRGPFVLRVVLGQVATLPLVIAGVAVLWVGREGFTG
jgi:hypothetical protein